jgi:vesicle-fusing ATPase
LTESVSALFAGPPGTGKTMCASAMADALGCEVFRVDLSRVISKWIGETEKNLSRVFDEAERSGAILLFDEADSLFARRTAVNSATDRYANLAVNFLLQRMDSFRGITILTTNNEDAIDPAFRRRLTFRLRFEKPDAAERAELWRKVFPAAATIADDFDPDVLAHIAELSGAGIRNAAVRAAFLAASLGRTIDMELCSNAAIREAAEMGMLTCLPRSHQGPREIAHIEPQPQPQRALGAGARTIPITHPRRNGTMG